MSDYVASTALADERELKDRVERGWVPFAVTQPPGSGVSPRIWLRRGARVDRDIPAASNRVVDRECATCGGDRFVPRSDPLYADAYERCPECNAT